MPVTVCKSERLPASAGLTSATRAGSASTTARPSGAGSPPGWGPGRSAGDRPCWRAASCSAGPTSYPSSPRQSSSAACTAYCGVRHGLGSAGDVRDIRAASNRRRRPRVRVRLRLRKPKARRFSSDASSVGHSQRGTARPANGNPQPTPPPSPPQEQARGSWFPPLSACQRCGKQVSEHLLDAAVVTAIKRSVDHRRADSLLRMWWAEAHRWALYRPTVSPDDEALLHDTLHHLATHGPPDKASSLQPEDGDAVTIELAGRGLGPAGSVQVPDDLWAQWAKSHFQRAGEAAPTAPESLCPKVAALLRRLNADGLVDKFPSLTECPGFC